MEIDFLSDKSFILINIYLVKTVCQLVVVINSQRLQVIQPIHQAFNQLQLLPHCKALFLYFIHLLYQCNIKVEMFLY